MNPSTPAAAAFFGSVLLFGMGMISATPIAVTGVWLWATLFAKAGKKPDPNLGQFGSIHIPILAFLALLCWAISSGLITDLPGAHRDWGSDGYSQQWGR